MRKAIRGRGSLRSSPGISRDEPGRRRRVRDHSGCAFTFLPGRIMNYKWLAVALACAPLCAASGQGFADAMVRANAADSTGDHARAAALYERAYSLSGFDPVMLAIAAQSAAAARMKDRALPARRSAERRQSPPGAGLPECCTVSSRPIRQSLRARLRCWYSSVSPRSSFRHETRRWWRASPASGLIDQASRIF